MNAAKYIRYILTIATALLSFRPVKTIRTRVNQPTLFYG